MTIICIKKVKKVTGPHFIFLKMFNFFLNDQSCPVVGPLYVWSHITYSKSMDQPGKAANLARGQLNRVN